MGVSPISFLSFKVIFHWTMIVGERISTGGSPKKGTWTFPNRCVGRFLFGTWNPPGAAFLFASLENIRRYHFVRQLDCWFLGVSKFMDINSSLGHFWRVFGATNASSSTDSLGFLWCFFLVLVEQLEKLQPDVSGRKLLIMREASRIWTSLFLEHVGINANWATKMALGWFI